MGDSEMLIPRQSGKFGMAVKLVRPKLDEYQMMVDYCKIPNAGMFGSHAGDDAEYFFGRGLKYPIVAGKPCSRTALVLRDLLKIPNAGAPVYHTNINNNRRARAIEVCIPLGRKACKVTMHIPIVTPELFRETYYALGNVLQREFGTSVQRPVCDRSGDGHYELMVGSLDTYTSNNRLYLSESTTRFLQSYLLKG